MAQITHELNGNDFGEPRNWRDLEISIEWLLKKDTGTINVSDLSFVGEANKYLQKRILDGLNGGVGIFEGEPYKIKIGDPNNPVFVFDGYLDMSEPATVIGGEEISLSLKKTKGDDWLSDVADGFSFAYLYEIGSLKQSDFVKIPYVINYIPDGMQIIVLSMSIYMMTKELVENAQKLAETIADTINASTAVIGVSVGLGAGVVTAWDLGDWIMVALKALARIAYIIALTVAIINLMDDLFEQIIQKQRNHLGMTFRRMFEIGCQHLNLSFESDIDDLDLVHIPRKSKKGGSNGETGFPTNTEPISGFGDFIREMKKMFNADFRIINGKFIFKRVDQFRIPSSFKMPNFFNDQTRLLDVHGFNTDEMVSNYNIYYALDVQDQNTLDFDSGRVLQAITTPKSTTNKDLVTIKGFADVSVPFSLGREKRNLTAVEEVAKILGSIVDGLTGVFGRGTRFKSKIEGRIGSLLLSSHFLTNGKVVKMAGSKLATNQRDEVGAKMLWDKYHFVNSLAEYNGHNNQWWRFENQVVPMTEEQFFLLMSNNYATDDRGFEYMIERCVYIPHSSRATMNFRVKKKYTNNLKIELL